MTPSLHPIEEKRIERLKAFGILDTPRETRFDRLVFIAAQALKVPIASISLVDRHRQWFKASVGLGITETPREHAFCARAILQDDVMIVEDAREDARFVANPLVTGEPFIRFYAGVPLVTVDALPLGSFCVVDRKPRRISDDQVALLVSLAHEAEAMIQALDIEGLAAE